MGESTNVTARDSNQRYVLLVCFVDTYVPTLGSWSELNGTYYSQSLKLRFCSAIKASVPEGLEFLALVFFQGQVLPCQALSWDRSLFRDFQNVTCTDVWRSDTTWPLNWMASKNRALSFKKSVTQKRPTDHDRDTQSSLQKFFQLGSVEHNLLHYFCIIN